MVINDAHAHDLVRLIDNLVDLTDAAAATGGARRLVMRRRVARVLSMVELRPGMRVLEIGTISGHSARLAARLGDRGGSAISVDPDREAIDRARGMRAGRKLPRLSFQTGEVRDGVAAGRPV